MNRVLTIDINGELVNLLDGTFVDYTSISNESTIRRISEAYCGKLSDYSNEVFINLFVKKMEWLSLIDKKDHVKLSSHVGLDGYIWNDIVRLRTGVNISLVRSMIMCAVSFISLFVCSLGFPFFCAAKSLLAKTRVFELGARFSIVRSEASYEKIGAVSQQLSIVMLSEDVTYRNHTLSSVFSYVSTPNLIKAIPTIIRRGFVEYGLLRKELHRYFGARCTQYFMCRYAPRIVLKCCFEELLINILKQHASDLVTGNKEDRFAMVEKRIAAKFGRTLTCIPHGLEYSYRFPGGLAGDEFYCTSEKSAKVLRQVYASEAFIFDSYLNQSIYGGLKGPKKRDSFRQVIFFTEPRNIQINRRIIKALIDTGVPFGIKLHPNDRSSNYSDSSLFFVDTLKESLLYPVCIARKSTILLNATCLGHYALAILIDSKDYFYANYVFPSLSHPGIKKLVSEEELKTILKEFL